MTVVTKRPGDTAPAEVPETPSSNTANNQENVQSAQNQASKPSGGPPVSSNKTAQRRIQMLARQLDPEIDNACKLVEEHEDLIDARTAKQAKQKKVMQQKMDAREQAYVEGKEYEKAHARLAAKFPEIGPADGEPLGIKLSRLEGPVLEEKDFFGSEILNCYERDPDPKKAPPFRERTLTMQLEDHGGMPDKINQGDFKNVHNATWMLRPGDKPHTKQWGPGRPYLIEGRADRPNAVEKAKGRKAINRIQPSAPRHAGLGDCKVFMNTDPKVREKVLEIGPIWASGNIIYSTKALSDGAKGDVDMDDVAKDKLALLARDAYHPAPELFVNPYNMHDKHKEGINCVSAAMLLQQVAKLHVMMEEAQTEAKEKGVAPPTFRELVDKLEGFYAANAFHTSVRSLEHHMIHGVENKGTDKEKPQFEFKGKYHAPKKAPFEETLPPMQAAQRGALPDTHPHSIAYVERQQKKEAEIAAEIQAARAAVWNAAEEEAKAADVE